MTKRIEVVGAVIVRHGLVLCAQRASSATLPGLWEFPGGKIEGSETPEQALSREIMEELGVSVEVGERLTTTEHPYDFGLVVLSTYYCGLLFGEPEPLEHSRLRWVPVTELASLDWAPADIPALEVIRTDFGPVG